MTHRVQPLERTDVTIPIRAMSDAGVETSGMLPTLSVSVVGLNLPNSQNIDLTVGMSPLEEFTNRTVTSPLNETPRATTAGDHLYHANSLLSDLRQGTMYLVRGPLEARNCPILPAALICPTKLSKSKPAKT